MTDVPGWMKTLGVQERLDGFDARMFGANPLAFDSAADWTSLSLRFFRAVVIVSLVEEIFWRGFLMRWLLESRWQLLEGAVRKAELVELRGGDAGLHDCARAY